MVKAIMIETETRLTTISTADMWNNCDFDDKSIRFLAHCQSMPYGNFLAIGPSQICPIATMAAIFQNGRHYFY